MRLGLHKYQEWIINHLKYLFEITHLSNSPLVHFK
jgi:hypothetical protein